MNRISLLFFLLFALLFSNSRAVEDSYDFAFLEEGVELEIGEKGEFQLSIQMKQKGAYIHPKAPFKINLEASGLILGQSTLTQKDASKRFPEEKARELLFDGTFSAKKPGDYRLEAQLEFFFCTAEICEKRESKTSVLIKVKN